MFSSESDLINSTLPLLEEVFLSNDEFKVIQEPKGLFGVPDLVIYNGTIISVEFKLKNWRRALQQAYRYKNFSSESYVFLDEGCIKAALNNIREFIHYNIGLCGVAEDGINIYHKPSTRNAFSSEMFNRVFEIFNSDTTSHNTALPLRAADS